jgi:hypothetical protein
MRRRPFTKWNLTLAALLATSGCVGGLGGTTASREPGFRAASVRRPALLVRVSVPAELDKRERDRIAEDYQAAVVEGLLVEPPAEDLRAVDVELDCKTGRLIRQKSMDELIADSVGLVLAPFGSL